jgi:hypothetical protein
MSFLWIVLGICVSFGIVGLIAAIRNEKRCERELSRIAEGSELRRDHI